MTTPTAVCLRKENLNIFLEKSHWYYTKEPLRHNSDVELSDGWKLSKFSQKGKRLSEPTVYAHLLRERLDGRFSYLVIDIETSGSLESPTFEMIGLLFKDGEKTERYILRGEPEDVMPSVSRLIEKLNPTVIVGHNIFGFDIPVIAKWLPFEGERRTIRFGAETAEVTVYTYGGFINCVDTYLLSRRCDAMGIFRADSFSLKRLSEALGFKRKTADKFDGSVDYLVEDLEATVVLFEYLIQWFIGLFPFANVSWASIYEGNGTIIENTMVSHLIAHKAGLGEPDSREGDTYVGGYVELLQSGVFDNVYKVDVVSLYPNIMVKYISPRWDKGFFKELVRRMLEKRLENKEKGNHSAQYGLKILINSIYGFLGSPRLFLNDISAAEKITEIGRATVHKMKRIIEENGGTPIEIDTDGIYFTGDGEKIHAAIKASLEFETELEHFDRGLFVKKKNYALWKDGKRILHGNSLKGRRDGSVQQKVLDIILDHYPEVEPLLVEAIDAILTGKLVDVKRNWKSTEHETAEDAPTLPKERIDLAEKAIAVCRRFDSLPEIQQFLERYGSRKQLKQRQEGLLQFSLFP